MREELTFKKHNFEHSLSNCIQIISLTIYDIGELRIQNLEN